VILGYIELSKRRFSPEVVEKYREKYSKAMEVNFILRHVADLLNYKTDEELEDLYKKTAWYFEEKFKKQSSSASFAYDIFKQAIK
jgi:translation initiation factor 2 subunit 1